MKNNGALLPPRWSNRDCLCSLTQTTKNPMKYVKQLLDTGPQAAEDTKSHNKCTPSARGSKLGDPYKGTNPWTGREFPASAADRRNPGRAREPTEAKCPGFTEQSAGEERAAQRPRPWRCARGCRGPAAGFWPARVCEDTAKGGGGTTTERGQRGQTLKLTQGQVQFMVLPATVGNLTIYRVSEHSAGDSLLILLLGLGLRLLWSCMTSLRKQTA